MLNTQNTGLHFFLYIWIQRNSCLFDGVQVNTDTILTLFIKQINFRMLADRSRFPRSMYIKYWGNNASVSVCYSMCYSRFVALIVYATCMFSSNEWYDRAIIILMLALTMEAEEEEEEEEEHARATKRAYSTRLARA